LFGGKGIAAITRQNSVIADAYSVGKVLYPERFDDVNLSGKADQVYDFLVGKPVYQQMAKSLGCPGGVPDYLDQ
jgi:iron complex transport system substrate-binding protein